ncbi:MAG: nucleotidyltransferase [Candidatus Lokiarchaeota archaeon]|nr:nucleotidyltransferase [Candidatus Lokiarchaeota archaeon]MBD3202029.1 nucleotidyltransferase [Candidatus Lokiarchaeota archaeon]
MSTLEDLDKSKIINLLKTNKDKLKKYYVKQIGIFGSFSRGESTSKSDIDLLIEFEDGKKDYDNYIEVIFFLEKILQRDVDVVTFEALSPYMKSKIIEETHFEKF